MKYRLHRYKDIIGISRHQVWVAEIEAKGITLEIRSDEAVSGDKWFLPESPCCPIVWYKTKQEAIKEFIKNDYKIPIRRL